MMNPQIIASVSSETVHATCVAIGGHAVLIEGASGSGKSDLGLRLIDRGAILVSDDYTICQRMPSGLVATAPPTIAGKLEVRGLGIIPLPHADRAAVALVVRLTHDVERMPPERTPRRIAGVEIAEILLDPRAASAPIKVEMALRRLLSADGPA